MRLKPGKRFWKPGSEGMKFTSKVMPTWQKQLMAIAGLSLALSGLPMIVGYFCITLVMTLSDDHEAITVGLISFTLMIVTVGAGGITFWHSLRSLQGRHSRPLYLPPVWLLIGMAFFLGVMGLFVLENDFAAGVFFPPILLAAAALPPLWAVSWFMGQSREALSWRRGLVAFAGGATVSVVIALTLASLFPAVILALVFNLANLAIDRVGLLFAAVAREDMASVFASRGFIYLFIQLVIIVPLVEELTKPLVTLPLIGRLSRREVFLVGAMAGAGFAMVESVVYAGFGLPLWVGILAMSALGGAIQPLGSGLVALSWRDVLRGEDKAWSTWFARLGLAVGIHAFWNGGSLLVIILAGSMFYGELPPPIDAWGITTTIVTLMLLVALGLLLLGIGRSIGERLGSSSPVDFDFTLSDRIVAVGATLCLMVIVPAGIAGWQLLVR